MKIIATNLAEIREVEWQGKMVKTGIYKFPVDEPIFLEKEDVKNDHVIDRKYHGGVDKACYLYSADHYGFWKEKYPDLDWQWGMLGENLTIEGLDESQIFIGDIFEIGEAVVQISQPRYPCYKLGFRFGSQVIVREFLESPYPGIYVRIIKEGNVKAGDAMTLIEKAEKSMSVRETFSFFTSQIDNIDGIKKAIAIPQLAEAWRKDLKKLQ